MDDGIELKKIYRLLYGWELLKRNCPHSDTTVHYREEYAGGDFIVWKEFCDVCNVMVATGWDEYKPVLNRRAKPAPGTKFDEGYVINWQFLEETFKK